MCVSGPRWTAFPRRVYPSFMPCAARGRLNASAWTGPIGGYNIPGRVQARSGTHFQSGSYIPKNSLFCIRFEGVLLSRVSRHIYYWHFKEQINNKWHTELLKQSDAAPPGLFLTPIVWVTWVTNQRLDAVPPQPYPEFYMTSDCTVCFNQGYVRTFSYLQWQRNKCHKAREKQNENNKT